MIDGLEVLSLDKGFTDKRGIIYTTSHESIPDGDIFREEKISISHKNVLRGFHGDSVTNKLFSCFSGELKIVVVDRRRGSPTFFTGDKEVGYFSQVLNQEDNIHIFVPKGCINAHYVLADNSVLHYKTTVKYNGIESQQTVKWDDPIINGFSEVIDPLISDRDYNGLSLEEVLL